MSKPASFAATVGVLFLVVVALHSAAVNHLSPSVGVTPANDRSPTPDNAVVEQSPRSPRSEDSPFVVREGMLYARVNRSTDMPDGLEIEIAKLDSQNHFQLPVEVTRAVIEIGTNDEPEMTPVLRDASTVLVALEPRFDAFLAMRGRFPAPIRSRLVALPAAVSSTGEGYVKMNVGGHRGCSSLLPQSSRMRAFAAKEKLKARRRSQAIQLRTVEWCAKTEGVVDTPSITIREVLERLPKRVAPHLLMTDAQGYDTHVLSTLPTAAAATLPFIVVECQDLPPHDLRMMLVEGAPTCADQRACVERWFPHRLSYCWFNAPKVRELNCLYAHPRVESFSDPALRVLPPNFKVVGTLMNITYDRRKEFSCPTRSG